MKYMLLIYMEGNAMNETEREHCYVGQRVAVSTDAFLDAVEQLCGRLAK